MKMELTKEELKIIEAKRAGKDIQIIEKPNYKKYEGKLKEKIFFMNGDLIEDINEMIDNLLADHIGDIYTEKEKEDLIKKSQKIVERAINNNSFSVKKGTKFEYDEEEGDWYNKLVNNKYGSIEDDTFESKFLTDVKEIK